MSESLPLDAEIVVAYPRSAEVGKRYLMTVDLAARSVGTWPYEREEYPVYCAVNGEPAFEIEPVGEPAVVIHRFGGTYGPARFILNAVRPSEGAPLRLSLVNAAGLPLRTLELKDVSVWSPFVGPEAAAEEEDSSQEQIQEEFQAPSTRRKPSIYELIQAKRDGHVLDPDDIREFIAAYGRGEVPDYQMSAMCVAISFRGLSSVELDAWTRALMESGEVLELSWFPGIKVGMHSTGGLGDKVALSVVPLVAACGVSVQMFLDRGRGDPGGTLNRLRAIPGFRPLQPNELHPRRGQEIGARFSERMVTVAPAERRISALLEATGTEDSLPLIASSIMSRRLAEGTDALLLDVKVGNGALTKRIEDARALARMMVGLGALRGRRVTALITDLDQPLGRAIGGALEVMETVDLLRGRPLHQDFTEVTLALSTEMLVLGGRAANAEEARSKLMRALEDGSALNKLREIVVAQGGNPRAITVNEMLPQARGTMDFTATASGFVTGIDMETLARAAGALREGPQGSDGSVDPAAGFWLLRKVGEPVRAGEPVVRVHYNDASSLKDVLERLGSAYHFGTAPPPHRPPVWERLD